MNSELSQLTQGDQSKVKQLLHRQQLKQNKIDNFNKEKSKILAHFNSDLPKNKLTADLTKKKNVKQ